MTSLAKLHTKTTTISSLTSLHLSQLPTSLEEIMSQDQLLEWLEGKLQERKLPRMEKMKSVLESEVAGSIQQALEISTAMETRQVWCRASKRSQNDSV